MTDASHITATPDPRTPKPKRISAAKQRKLVETAIERPIDLLDAIEPDPDLEDNADGEPSLGWPIPDQRWGNCTGDNGGDDREGDTADDEPWLGWTEMEARYGKYSELSCSDLEEQCEDEGAEHDGREPDVDDEVQSWTNPMAENCVGEVRS